MRRNNLPVQLTSFIGRERELDELTTALSAARMLTLTGSGGCGKTRLAIEVASALGDGYAGGVALVDLANVRDRELVASALAAALGLQDQKVADPVAALVAHLQPERALIIIDNCEHLIATVADIADRLLKGCSQLSLLATSREPLGLPSETTWRVPSLSFPDENPSPEAEELMRYDAVGLFVDRALKVRPNFKLTAENASAVAQICSRLDGIPLAIELAAARVKVLTPHQIADGLADRFHLLTGGSRVGMPRQQTLQASVEWSYELLNDREKRVLDALSVFAGGFTLDAAEAVCPNDQVGSTDVLDILERLVDKSLVIADIDEGLAARYRLLETIRQFALERLVESERAEQVRTRHMEYFLDFGRPSLEDPEILPFGVPPEMRREVDNFRAAMRWTRGGDDPTIAVRLATQLGRILGAVGQRREALSLFEDVLASAHDAAPAALARAWTARGWTVLWSHVEEKLVECGLQALRFAQTAGDERATQSARALIAQAAILSQDGAAVEAATEEMERHTLTPFDRVLARSFKGAHLINTGELDRAKEQFEEAATIARADVEHILGTVLVHLGYIALLQGELDRARTLADEATIANRRRGDLDPRTFELSGFVALCGGDVEAARTSFEDGLDVSRQRQLTSFEGLDHAFLALVAIAEGDLDAAHARLRTFESIGLSFDFECGSRTDSVFLAMLYRVVDLYDNTREILGRIDEASVRPDDDMVVAITALRLAVITRADGSTDGADALAFEALQTFRRIGARIFLVESLELIAGLAADQGDFREAARLLAAVDSIRRELRYVRFPIDQPRYDADLARVEETLAEDFSSIWDEGAGMTLEEAADYALRGRGERKRPSIGWASLTPTELKVSALITDGLSNPVIAERLFISRHTVETHLKNIYAKLGISSRTQLAGEAVRRGLKAEVLEASKLR